MPSFVQALADITALVVNCSQPCPVLIGKQVVVASVFRHQFPQGELAQFGCDSEKLCVDVSGGRRFKFRLNQVKLVTNLVAKSRDGFGISATVNSGDNSFNILEKRGIVRLLRAPRAHRHAQPQPSHRPAPQVYPISESSLLGRQ